ncbi:MAG: RHS repeat-associated core domain-containing protein [Pseudomonas sp.]
MKKNERSALYFYQGEQLSMSLLGTESRRVSRGTKQPLAERVRGGGRDGARMLATDAHSSVLELHTTQYAQSLCYSAYGYSAENGLWLLLRFNGERHDSLTGCYFLGNGHRVFSPALMRFYSPDIKSPFSSGGPHSYAYCAGDPVNLIDPSGNTPVRPLAPVNHLRKLRPPSSRREARRAARELHIDAGISREQEHAMRSAAERERASATDAQNSVTRDVHLAHAEHYEQEAIEYAADRRRYTTQTNSYLNLAGVNPNQEENRIPSRTRTVATQPATTAPSQDMRAIRQDLLRRR